METLIYLALLYTRSLDTNFTNFHESLWEGFRKCVIVDWFWEMALADIPALGIAEESPQPDVGGARTWNGKPDPLWVTPK
ncbi:hypothetical protein H7U19_13510 [Hyunsoonleella sp. SJ7]|uniref:Uncharacterized protein n=1 Tax=Hyunsoonleella aquatilis TaxID=2762758 RepID=A0A923HDZ8_9FLAO|nr:hypothetical protein [Hyunsoonleella aquatilis]MBC3759431.1 hypothetical protein [Hyunsoonleella aquatilis]